MAEPDLLVIGAGPAGLAAATMAARHRLHTVLVEAATLGGTCLNHGCIPLKTLLHRAKTEKPFHLPSALTRLRSDLETLRRNLRHSLRDITLLQGQARLDGKAVLVGPHTFRPRHILIATGSVPLIPDLPGASSCLTPETALSWDHTPSRVAVIGAGPTGLEYATLLGLAGAEVLVLEARPRILPSCDPDLVGIYLRHLPAQVRILTSCQPLRIDEDRTVVFRTPSAEERWHADAVILATGRTPRLDLEELARSGVAASPQGIRVDEAMRTSAPNILAAGDVTGRTFHAHTAARMAETAVRTVLGLPDRIDWDRIPWTVHGVADLGGCGLSESQALHRAIPVRTAKIPLSANPKHLCLHGPSPSLLKLVVEKTTGTVLGVFLCGIDTADLVATATLAVGRTVTDLDRLVLPHPTLAESLKDACRLLA